MIAGGGLRQLVDQYDADKTLDIAKTPENPRKIRLYDGERIRNRLECDRRPRLAGLNKTFTMISILRAGFMARCRCALLGGANEGISHWWATAG